MTLAEVEQVLAQWRGHVPGAWGEPRPSRSPRLADDAFRDCGLRDQIHEDAIH
jgi:hypothetical protein